MHSVSLGTVIGESFNRVGRVLFSPPSPSKWLRLLLIAFMAGSLGTGGCGLQSMNRAASKPQAIERSGGIQAGKTNLLQSSPASHARYKFADSIFRPDPSQFPPVSRAWLAGVLIPFFLLLLLAAAALWVFGIWIGVRFKFMWLAAIRGEESGIRTLFRRFRRESEDLFDFWLGLCTLELVCYGAVIAWLVWAVFAVGGGWENRLEWSPVMAFRVVAPPLAAAIIVWIVFSTGRVVGDDFLVPLALRYPGSSASVWKKWIAIYCAQRGRVWGYLLMRLGFAIGWGVFSVTAILLYVLAWAVVFAVCFGLYALAARAWPALKPLFLFYSVLVGGPLTAALLIGIGAILLPGSVFLRDFSARMLDRFDPPEAA